MLKKIAIIGTSPIMTILAKEMSKRNDVTIFEKNSNIGGAWSLSKYKKIFFADKTNLIIPNDKKDAKFINDINKYLIKKLKLKIKKTKYKIFLQKTANFKPNFFYKYNINKLLKKNFLNKIKIIKQEVKNINLDKKAKILNTEFDQVYIPMYSSINKIKIKNKTHNSNYKKITSKHFFLLAEKINNSDFLYKEDFNEIFDRAQIIKKKASNAFTGRIRKKFKKKNKGFLMKNLGFTYQKLHFSKVISYTNYFRNEKQKRDLNIICNKSKLINLIDTSNFVTGYSQIKKYFHAK